VTRISIRSPGASTRPTKPFIRRVPARLARRVDLRPQRAQRTSARAPLGTSSIASEVTRSDVPTLAKLRRAEARSSGGQPPKRSMPGRVRHLSGWSSRIPSPSVSGK
jgi:hypothetical protein